jgi:colanic acid/amylovoran biosynthesis glycosyltransferase
VPAHIAYLMSRFPHLPETFILREMTELERQGWSISLYPLILQKQSVVHTEAQPWIPRAARLPYFSGPVLASNATTFFRQPLRYTATQARALSENLASPKFLTRALALWPKAVHAARLMKQAGVTHVHAHYATHPAFAAWVIHRLTGLSYSITVHAHDIFVEKAMLGLKLREAAFIAAISHFNREFLAREVGAWVREKTHIVHCGIVPGHYAPRRPPPGPGETFEIITIGSLQPYKGQRYLLEACARLREQGLKFRCRIVGGGELRPELEAQLAELKLAGWVELLGPQPQEEVARLLPTAHCYVQPSIITPSGKMEGIPVSLMEAMSCGLPVVATELSGVPELVRPGETGTLVPPADARALAEALAQVQASPDESGRLAKAGRELVLREFDLRTNVTRLAELFERQRAAP